MALVNCPYCNRENVSDDALFCPQCNKNVREYFYQLERKENLKAERAKMEQELKENAEEIQRKKIEQLNTERNDAVPKAALFGLLTLLFLTVTILSIKPPDGTGFQLGWFCMGLFMFIVCVSAFFGFAKTGRELSKKIKLAKKDMHAYNEAVLKRQEEIRDEFHLPYEHHNIKFFCDGCGKGIENNSKKICPECGKSVIDEFNRDLLSYHYRAVLNKHGEWCHKCGSKRVRLELIKESKRVHFKLTCEDCGYTWS
ncbi:MAG: hypothetical protein ACI4GY_02930 [Acutalibacteraceae bacterium]